MKVVVLTSSRAEYGIYFPLLKLLREDPFFDLKIIVFGTHLSAKHGNTVDQIIRDGFTVDEKAETLPDNDSPGAIAHAMGLTVTKFSSIWDKRKNDCDLILCIGDRYEMFSAVSASVPFQLRVAHIHGGETTLGAIDNIFRHSLSLMSSYHFASTERSCKRIEQLIDSKENIYNVGALSLDNIRHLRLLSTEEMKHQFGIDLEKPSVLVTFHPETVAFEQNERYIEELIKAMSRMTYQLIITMPNADTMGDMIRKKLHDFIRENSSRAVGIESFGTLGYFSCMRHARFLLGNSSSGIIEAASFGKYVINVGDRQKGREAGPNVIHCRAKEHDILKSVKLIQNAPVLGNNNIYGDGSAAEKIIKVLKEVTNG